MDQLSNFIKTFSVAGTLSIVASIWSKTSFALTILRITDGWVKKLVWFLIISMNIFMGLTAIFNFAHCQPLAKVFDPMAEGTCWPSYVLLNYNLFSAGMPLPFSFSFFFWTCLLMLFAKSPLPQCILVRWT